MTLIMKVLETINHKYLWSTYSAQGSLLRKSENLISKSEYQRCFNNTQQLLLQSTPCLIAKKTVFTVLTSALEGVPPSVTALLNPQLRTSASWEIQLNGPFWGRGRAIPSKEDL